MSVSAEDGKVQRCLCVDRMTQQATGQWVGKVRRLRAIAPNVLIGCTDRPLITASSGSSDLRSLVVGASDALGFLGR